jgi:phage-related tail fiber protein
MNPYGTIITDAGAELIAAALLEGRKQPVVWAAAGDGNGQCTAPGREQTTLVHELWRGEIASAELNPSTPNMIDIKFTLPDDVGGFTIRELGLFSDSGVLIAVGNTPDTEKASISQGVSGRLTVTMHLLLADASVLEFVINPTLDMVSRKELEDHVKTSIAAHNTDPEAHPNLRETCAGLDARLSLLELMYATDISGNPFTVTFGSLGGLTAAGVHNTALARLEF